MANSIAVINQIVKAPATKWAVGGWIFFLLENAVLSENRDYIIHQLGLGEDGYHYAYGTCSTIAMGSIVYGYIYKVRNSMPHRLPIPLPWKIAGWGMQTVAVVLASQAAPRFQIPVYYKDGNDSNVDNNIENTRRASSSEFLKDGKQSRWKVRCPFDFSDSRSLVANPQSDGPFEPRGLDRVTRHPGLWSFGLFSLGTAVSSVVSYPQVLCLSMPMAVAWLGGAHQDSRHRRGMGGKLPEDVDRVTSNVPFWALARGVQPIRPSTDEFKGLNAAIATGALWVGLFAAQRRRPPVPSFLR